MTAASNVTNSTRETRFAFMITHNLLFAAGGTTLDHARGCQNHANAEANIFRPFRLEHSSDRWTDRSNPHNISPAVGLASVAPPPFPTMRHRRSASDTRARRRR